MQWSILCIECSTTAGYRAAANNGQATKTTNVWRSVSRSATPTEVDGRSTAAAAIRLLLVCIYLLTVAPVAYPATVLIPHSTGAVGSYADPIRPFASSGSSSSFWPFLLEEHRLRHAINNKREEGYGNGRRESGRWSASLHCIVDGSIAPFVLSLCVRERYAKRVSTQRRSLCCFCRCATFAVRIPLSSLSGIPYHDDVTKDRKEFTTIGKWLRRTL